jgi:hypothetical protein
MSKKILTTDGLVAAVKRRVLVPNDQITFTKQDIIDILNEEMDHSLIPHLLSVHEEHLVNYVDFPILQNGKYRIPVRAIGNKVRNVCFINERGSQITKLTRIELENLENKYDGYGFWIENDVINLVGSGDMTGAGILRIYYQLSPGKLVEDKNGAIIQSINHSTGQIIVDKVPAVFSVESLYDFTGAQSPNKLINMDIACTGINVSTRTLEFSPNTISADVKIGDHITINMESVVPQVPTELHGLLAQYASLAILESLGDVQSIQIAAARLEKIKSATVDLIDNRVEGSNQKINNIRSPLSMRNHRRNIW